MEVKNAKNWNDCRCDFSDSNYRCGSCLRRDPTPKHCPPTTAKQWKIALLLPDVITDPTWNGLAYQAVPRLVAEGIADKFSYTEQVAIPDAVRIASGYAAEGYDLIIQHGSQFVDTT
ncbi:MAG: hypothetical protein H5T49_05845, partial [Hadesarchaea archaeon]|nr:hypothetical protein [Hadesarchaea archaeon]